MKLHQSILEHWHCRFDDLQLSSNDFYTALETTIAERKLPHVSCRRVELSEANLFFSSRREYLNCSLDDGFEFIICAAPFGKTFFISWWLKSYTGIRAAIYPFIPFIGKFLTNRLYTQTCYQADTEIMFKETIKRLVEQTVEGFTEAKGIRASGISELSLTA